MIAAALLAAQSGHRSGTISDIIVKETLETHLKKKKHRKNGTSTASHSLSLSILYIYNQYMYVYIYIYVCTYIHIMSYIRTCSHKGRILYIDVLHDLQQVWRNVFEASPWRNGLSTGAFYVGNGWVAGGFWDDY